MDAYHAWVGVSGADPALAESLGDLCGQRVSAVACGQCRAGAGLMLEPRCPAHRSGTRVPCILYAQYRRGYDAAGACPAR